MFSNANRLPIMPKRNALIAITISMYVAPAQSNEAEAEHELLR